MEIILHLSGHCIETAAKRRYEKIILELLNAEVEDKEKEKELEMLTEFLKVADFTELRRSGFDGRREMKVRIRRAENNFLVEEI